jgi:hypothetical protein
MTQPNQQDPNGEPAREYARVWSRLTQMGFLTRFGGLGQWRGAKNSAEFRACRRRISVWQQGSFAFFTLLLRLEAFDMVLGTPKSNCFRP